VSTYLPLFMLLIIIFITQRNEKMMIKNILSKRKMGDSKMFELAKSFLGKECVIYTFNSQLTGVIKEINNGGILIDKAGNLELVNFDFIVRIREYPRNKNGKKKSVIID